MSSGDTIIRRRRQNATDLNNNDPTDSAPEKRESTSTINPIDEELYSRAQTRTAKLWLDSRIESTNPTVWLEKGHERHLSLQNLKLAIALLREVWWRLTTLFLEGQSGMRVMGFVAGKFIRGLVPTARLWSSSRMLDVVQKSFENKGIDRMEVLTVASSSLLFHAADDMFEYFTRNNAQIVRQTVNHTFEKAYLSTQLSLTIPALSSPYISALMYEAGVFTAVEARITPYGATYSGGAPFDNLTTVFDSVTTIISITSQIYLLLSTMTPSSISTTNPSKTTGSSFLPWNIDLSSLFLIAFSVAPSILRVLASFMGMSRPRGRRMNWNIATQDERHVKEMGKNGQYKQEVVLFGLKDWVLERWDELTKESEKAQRDSAQGYREVEMGLGLVQEGVQTSFYVLLALQILPTTLSLGSIRLYQQTTSSLINSIRSLSGSVTRVFNLMFFLGAYIEAIELPSHPHLLRPKAYQHTILKDYESTRISGGMKLQAQNLSFKYPQSDQTVLKDINLTIEPGSTLAIVGLNGGGKTTLVKVLMGLYDFDGELLLNGNDIRSYDPLTIHARTSCLFQDFSKYSFTLKENVGLGEIGSMNNEEKMKEAIKRGGADGILEKVGLEGRLNRANIPHMNGGDEIQIGNKNQNMGPFGFIGFRGGGAVTSNGFTLPFRPPGMGMFRRGGGRPPGASRSSGDLLSNGTEGRGRRGPPPGFPPGPPPGMEMSGLPMPPPPPGMEGGRPPSPPREIKEMMKEDKKEREEMKEASLSGGQWQRVALSRAFMRAGEADLVVFDEPSASLDPRAEAQLFERIHALSHQSGRKCTTIYISHRFSTVRRADQIAVVENGTILEIGSHPDLISKAGRYAELYNLQKAGFEDD